MQKLSEGEMRLLGEREGEREKQMKGGRDATPPPRDSKKEGTNTVVWDVQFSNSQMAL